MKDKFSAFPVFAAPWCPPESVYFLPQRSTSKNIATGEVLELAPGYYVNPKQLGFIKGIKPND